MRIGFISTRLAGTDGVSLETAKLAAVLQQMGHESFYCAGELDDHVPGLLAPELHFRDATAVNLGERAFLRGDTAVLPDIAKRARQLKKPLRQFLSDYQIEYLIIQNAFAIPMQLPLAQALAEILAETGLPALAHNHDFYWERERFRHSSIPAFLDTYFPPKLPNLRHAVINSAAQRDLKARRGIDSILIPNVFNFATPAPGMDDYNRDFRQVIGLSDDDWLILQPTRVIPRKGIELAIALLARLNDPRAKLVMTHHAGDEGLDYLHRLQTMAKQSGVDLRYVADRVDDVRRMGEDGCKIYALWDTYPHADLVAYPSLYEGFGNALIETIYFRKPAFVNRYAVYAEDIAPLGFQFVELDRAVTDEAVTAVRHILHHPAETAVMVEHNYQLGQQHFSYETLARLLTPFLGDEGERTAV
ncbi:MAG: glycosyltransferase family 4 protein [Ardenticatenaceae bacterium]|nr:glycosyltransferase family 4 protein [Anaerolineales bacterium]MCB8921309.1 glycosyltransferase family 4 protein [Ardenticatenaceae bacterium]MCB8990675.1 glycosyltransferase family 4 protein [Ardenticatenaceae bacterium]MCB9004066.1 glycosyltransferase family 4 protein [Ardenticatenaceae bacterium]